MLVEGSAELGPFGHGYTYTRAPARRRGGAREPRRDRERGPRRAGRRARRASARAPARGVRRPPARRRGARPRRSSPRVEFVAEPDPADAVRPGAEGRRARQPRAASSWADHPRAARRRTRSPSRRRSSITEAELDEMVAIARAAVDEVAAELRARRAPCALGLIVNPIAGLGGRVGLKGTDGADRRAARSSSGRARRARPRRARARAARALPRRAHDRRRARAMGGDAARAHGFETELRRRGAATRPRAADTRAAAAEMERRGVDLILFAGGDGTARDIVEAVGDARADPRHPDRREDALRRLRHEPGGGRRPAAALAVPRASAARGRGDRRRRGGARARAASRRSSTPSRGSARPAARAAPRRPARAPATAALEALCRELADGWTRAGSTLFGPGTTTRRILGHLGLEGTLLGIDAVDGRPARRRRPERGAAARAAPRRPRRRRSSSASSAARATCFGRGNQQLSPAVIRRVGLENIDGRRRRSTSFWRSIRRGCASTPATPTLDRELCRLPPRPCRAADRTLVSTRRPRDRTPVHGELGAASSSSELLDAIGAPDVE